MSDAALSERRPAALESSGPSNAMKSAASKTWRGERADVGPSAAAKSMEAAAGMESPNARKTWGGGRADMDSCGPAKPMQTAAPSKAGRDRRADVGNSAAMKLMKIAAAKPVVESAAGETGGDSAHMETGRWMYAPYARATQARGAAESMKRWSAAATQLGRRSSAARAQAPRRLEAGENGVRRRRTRNDHATVMMAPDRGAAKGV